GLALHAEGDQESADLRRARQSSKNLLEGGGHLALREVAAFDRLADHLAQRHGRPQAARAGPPAAGRRARKLPSSRFPARVRIDSGWNCPPSTKCSRCRTPMISPSVVHAERSSTDGRVGGSITSE